MTSYACGIQVERPAASGTDTGLKASGFWDRVLSGGAVAVAGEVLFLMAAAAAATMRNKPQAQQEDGAQSETRDGTQDQ